MAGRTEIARRVTVGLAAPVGALGVTAVASIAAAAPAGGDGLEEVALSVQGPVPLRSAQRRWRSPRPAEPTQMLERSLRA